MTWWAITDKGLVRRQNQDAYYTSCDEAASLAVLLVCDGMGGAKAGNVASALAEKIFAEETKKSVQPGVSPDSAAETLKRAINMANKAIFDLSNADDDCRGMGTTLVASVVSGNDAVTVNVGDSRAYLVSDGAIRQVTRDHSVVEDMVERGDITREQSRTHPNKNLITRAVGTVEDVACDTFAFTIKEKDILLLCSDGLSNLVSDEEILKEATSAGSIGECGKKLLDLAISRGAPDNVTLVLFQK